MDSKLLHLSVASQPQEDLRYETFQNNTLIHSRLCLCVQRLSLCSPISHWQKTSGPRQRFTLSLVLTYASAFGEPIPLSIGKSIPFRIANSHGFSDSVGKSVTRSDCLRARIACNLDFADLLLVPRIEQQCDHTHYSKPEQHGIHHRDSGTSSWTVS